MYQHQAPVLGLCWNKVKQTKKTSSSRSLTHAHDRMETKLSLLVPIMPLERMISSLDSNPKWHNTINLSSVFGGLTRRVVFWWREAGIRHWRYVGSATLVSVCAELWCCVVLGPTNAKPNLNSPITGEVLFPRRCWFFDGRWNGWATHSDFQLN